MGAVRILQGNVFGTLPTVEKGSMDCAVTYTAAGFFGFLLSCRLRNSAKRISACSWNSGGRG